MIAAYAGKTLGIGTELVQRVLAEQTRRFEVDVAVLPDRPFRPLAAL
jgi:hypothetical protein